MTRKVKLGFDVPLYLWALAASLLGIAAIWDAGMEQAAANNILIPGDVKVQVIALVISVLVCIGATFLPQKGWKKLVWPALILSFVLLLWLEFGPGAHSSRGAARWIRIGPLNFQPAEFAKLGAILFMAGILANRKPLPSLGRAAKHWSELADRVWVPFLGRIFPFVLVLALSVLVILQPDLATGAVIVVCMVGMLIAAGVRARWITGLVALMAVGGYFFVHKESYRLERITSHWSRWEKSVRNTVGYQTTESELAMARGGLIGMGMGQGEAKGSLPEVTTDFVMTTVAEEFGFLGTLVILGVLAGLTARLMQLAQKAEPFPCLIITGVAVWIAVQASVNLMMANGILPPIGIPMPFVSAGGTSMLALWFALGVCQGAQTEVVKEEAVATRRNRRRNRRTRLSRA